MASRNKGRPTARGSNGAEDTVGGSLTVAGVAIMPDSQSHGVVASLRSNTATAGQGVPATFTVRVINNGSATDTFNLTAALPAGFNAAFEQTSVVVPPGVSNFREISVQATPPLGTSATSYPVTFTATSATLPAIVGSSAGNVNVVNAGVDVSLNPAAAPAGTTFQLTVRNTGMTTDTFSLALAGPGALVSTLAQTSVTLAPGASQIVNVNVAAINFAVQPSLQLAAIATSQNNSAVKNMASAEITIPLTFAMTSEFEEDTIALATPGPGTFLLLVENLGNGEDAYEAEIITTTGPLSATLIGLDGSAVQTVPIFRLPGLSTGAIVLNANLAANGSGTITVRVRSLKNDNIISHAVATLRSNVIDFGDAPESYGTTLAGNGARHFAIGPQLGAVRDPETDGQPSATAIGDDNSSLPDDEDGVVLPGLFVAGTCDCSGTGLGNSITVNASASGCLDAWIDFNRNGKFDANEQIATSLRVVTGANTLSVSVPTSASSGSTFARFRISSTGGLTPIGEAADGEVEDYAVQLFNPSTGSSGIIVDPNNPTGRVLYVKGTGYSDAIVVRQTFATAVTVYVAPFGTTRSFPLNSFDRIVICALAGSDAIAVEAPITKPTVIYGDEDNDSISGGWGPDIIFGGSGVDSIAGWAGDDTISGGPGNDTLSGGDGIDRLVEFGSGTMTLSNTQFNVGGEINLFGYFEAATLIGGNAADVFNVTGWSWPVTIEGGGGTNTLIDGGNANFTLTETSLIRTGSTTRTIAVSGIQNAVLTGGSGNNTFNLFAWPFAATLDGGLGTDSFMAFGEGNMTLSDTMLMRPSLGMLRLNSLENATLHGNSSANTFNLSHWTKTATVNGAGGHDKLVASGNMNFTLSDSTLTRSSAGTITLSSIDQAELVGGAGNNTISAANFTGEVKLDGGSGNDTLTGGAGLALLLGGAGNDVLTAGSSRAVLIGGAGLDHLTGGASDDLLIAGQTSHDNDAAALALILAEWSSVSSYAARVANLTSTTGVLKSSDVDHDTAIDILLGNAGDDLFFAKLGSPFSDSLNDKQTSETAI